MKVDCNDPGQITNLFEMHISAFDSNSMLYFVPTLPMGVENNKHWSYTHVHSVNLVTVGMHARVAIAISSLSVAVNS